MQKANNLGFSEIIRIFLAQEEAYYKFAKLCDLYLGISQPASNKHN